MKRDPRLFFTSIAAVVVLAACGQPLPHASFVNGCRTAITVYTAPVYGDETIGAADARYYLDQGANDLAPGESHSFYASQRTDRYFAIVYSGDASTTYSWGDASHPGGTFTLAGDKCPDGPVKHVP